MAYIPIPSNKLLTALRPFVENLLVLHNAAFPSLPCFKTFRPPKTIYDHSKLQKTSLETRHVNPCT